MTIPATKDLLDFSGKTVIVTGSGSGLGQGIALRFGEAGANVVVNYLRSEAGARALAESIRKLGSGAIAIQADVTNRVAVETLVAGTVAEFGGLDVLINNAGVYPLASLADMKDEEWDLVVDSNLRSTFLCTQVAARHMVARGKGGAIVNIASVEGESPAPMHSHYNAAKGGVLMHTRAAANELGTHGIRVNAVSPGLIWREGLDQAWPDGVQRWKNSAPLGRLGMADDVADACLFLASPAARWITGVNLRVDGGVLSRPSF